MRAMDRGTLTALSKAGAFVRRTAKVLTRLKGGRGKSKQRISKPGSPPLMHTGQLNKNIYFGFDSSKRTVVIGPTRFGTGKAPGALEFGGSSVNSHGKTISVQKHSYMGPALDQNRSQIPAAFSNTVKSN